MILELAFVGLLYAIPLLGIPSVPVGDSGLHEATNKQPNKQEKPRFESMFFWVVTNGGRFVDTNRDDLVAVFTIVLAWSTIGLWSQTKRLAEGAVVQSNKMEESIAAANRNAAATQNAADAMQELAVEAETTRLSSELSAQRQLRAYIFIDRMKFARPETPNGDNEPWAIEIILKNTGQTPAYKAYLTAECEVGVAEKSVNTLLNLGDGKVRYPEAAIGPDTIQTARLTKGFLRRGLGDFQAYQNAGQKAYLWGRVDYIDAFGKRHWTSFQAVCHFGQSSSFAYCDRGNDTDDNFG